MNTPTIRQRLLQAIAELPDKALLELLHFVDYLRYKLTHTLPTTQPPKANENSEDSILQKRPFYETATPEEWLEEFTLWVDSHRSRNYPLLSDEAIGRESIYETRG